MHGRVASLVGALFLLGAAVLSMTKLVLPDGTACGTWPGYELEEHERFIATATVRRELAESLGEQGKHAAASRSEQKAEELDSADFACGNKVNEREFIVSVLASIGVGALLASKAVQSSGS